MGDEAWSAPHPAAGFLAALAKRPLAALFLLCLLAWLPGFATLPALDRDEARFAQASKQMVETGNLIDIRFGAEARYKKPIGIYWLQAASTKLLGQPPYNRIWTYRLPSLLAALAAAFLAFWSLRALAPPATAFVGAALLALTLGLTAEAHIAKTDAVLLASVLGAEGVLLRLYLAERDRSRARPGFALTMAGWAALAIGILIKGPVILGVVAITALAVSLWDRDGRWLATARPLPGIALLLALVLPWLVAIGIESHGQFFREALGHDFAGKLVGGQEAHGAPPGYYILLSTLTLWPATLFVAPGIGAAIVARKEPAVRFLLSWVVPNWLMFALVPTKLPNYVLPIYPALAFLAALWLMRESNGTEPRAQKILRWIASAQFAIGTLAVAAAIGFAPMKYGSGVPWWLIALAAVGGAIGVGAAVLLVLRARLAALMAAVLSVFIFYPLLTWGVAPRLTQIWLSPQLAALVAKDRLPGDPPVVAAGYDEPSLVFLLGTGTRIATGAGAADIAAGNGGLAVIEARQDAKFLNELGRLGAVAVAVDRLEGINYSHGGPVAITVYRVAPPARTATPPVE